MPDQVVSQEELTGLREAVESWYDHVCDIYAESPGASDDYGGYSKQPLLLKQAGVHCGIESGAEHEQTRAMIAQEILAQTFAVTLPAQTDIKVDDLIVVTTLDNLRIRVTAVISPESWEMERRVLGTVLE